MIPEAETKKNYSSFSSESILKQRKTIPVSVKKIY
jgi:hypothetical protein